MKCLSLKKKIYISHKKACKEKHKKNFTAGRSLHCVSVWLLDEIFCETPRSMSEQFDVPWNEWVLITSDLVGDNKTLIIDIITSWVCGLVLFWCCCG